MDTIVLRTPDTSVVVDPARGLSITSLKGRSGDEWLFFDPDRGPSHVPSSASYDDVWRGGFEELFPSDAAGLFDGHVMPDHGELWRSPFEVTERTATAVSGRLRCSSVAAEVTKRITVSPTRPGVAIDYAIRNMGDGALRFLFKLHPAMRVEGGDVVELPGGTVTAVSPGFGELKEGDQPWPADIDLSRVRPREAKFQEFVYVRGVPDGWCGIRRARTGERFRLRYDLAVFPECWLFITYGGWRDYYTIVLEPCTNWPKDLGEAAARGRCAELAPGAELKTRVTVEIGQADD